MKTFEEFVNENDIVNENDPNVYDIAKKDL